RRRSGRRRRGRGSAAGLLAALLAGCQTEGVQLVALEAELALEHGRDPFVQVLARPLRLSALADCLTELPERPSLLGLQRLGLGDEGLQLLLLRRQLRHGVDERLQGAVEIVPAVDLLGEGEGHGLLSLSGPLWGPV